MRKYFYVIDIQYLGFRYSGWMKQPGVKTVELMIEKTIAFVLGHSGFKLLGTSRTDARVSAHQSAFELFLDSPVDANSFLAALNENLPADIRALGIRETDAAFNIIQAPRSKEYLYLFACGEKGHPFAAPLMTSFSCNLDIDRMKEGARLFEGAHHFIRYCTRPKPGSNFHRTVDVSRIEDNTFHTASFFPEKSYVYIVRGKGFLRHQVRLMMGQLVRLGRGEILLEDIRRSLLGNDTAPLPYIAPASGLILNEVRFD